MNDTELMLYILDRVSSILIYQDDIEGKYFTEFWSIGRTNWSHEVASEYREVLEKTYDKIIQWEQDK